ncbi:MAG: carboxypeptidase-like regulatory domain-containing protein [Chitinophagaceae bacterium]
MIKQIFSLLFASLASLALNAQFTVTGRIIDSASQQPLTGASVYAQNTTQGTITNSNGEFSLPLKSGGYELIVSFTGYQTKQIQVSGSDSQLGDILMLQEDKSLQEVIIKSSNEVPDGWEQYGQFFVDHFIGTTPFASETKLINPEVLKFYLIKRTNKLRVMATEPIQIRNEALGYELRFQLDSFIYYYETEINSYRGFCLYKEMEGHRGQRAKWAENRAKAYYGSKMHFMRSYYDSSLQQQGFTIDLKSGDGENSSFSRLANPYDVRYYGYIDSTGQVELWFPHKISVTYTRSKPEPEYLKQFNLPPDVPMQISYIDLNNAVFIQENGYFHDPRNWINQGYWSWKNLADQLPFDYSP